MIGYACINETLSSVGVTTNRGMIKKTFTEKGVAYASQLALKNIQDLHSILNWNKNNNILFFRISSDLFPWASEYKLSDLPDFLEISEELARCGDFAKQSGIRLTFHPGPFNKLCSSEERVLANTIKDLEHHALIFDLMGLERTPWAKINIHVGAAYDSKIETAKVFCKNFRRLSSSLQSRLTVENDDKASLFSTKELYDLVYKEIKIPIVHDIHHHTFCDGGLSDKDAMALAGETWGNIIPVVHYSESRSIEMSDPKCKPQAHSDYIFSKICLHGFQRHVMVEAKKKELALLQYRKSHTEE